MRKHIVYNKLRYYNACMDTIGFEVAETARLIRRGFDRRAAALGATRSQWRVLARLARQDGQRQVDLADSLDVEPMTLCRMVDRLEEIGLVERRRDDEDRRAWRIHLTDKARPVIGELQVLAEAFHDELLAGVSDADRAAVSRVLAAIRDNLNMIETKAKVA